MNTAEHCKCPHHKIGAYLIILLGLVFLLGTMGILSGMVVAYSWPVILILFGIARLMGGSCRCYMRA